MNYFFIAAAILSLTTCVGHFTYGVTNYLKPMLNASFDPVAKAVIHCVFHYVSAFLVLSTLVLAGCGLDLVAYMQGISLVLFVALNFALFAIWQIYIAFVSDIKSPFKHLFQWSLFSAISALSLMGIYLN
ncbi:hypothetical protein FM038_009500 [Shewanella eurypsychrophilus]|uniref:DUF423 domain-containing protein n=1 Tax=Shewanella eurypsychrophilus TaxID=2593656 RepID=A0ABX6V4Y2_9GAMM|nr:MULTISPECIES: hypothetical protein [Shewanella]QFU22367.1 hypothetical protein FS418_11080 [Shewanella sp. YLB-09]QPG57654.1 hypothetical protein FM038_009500 [Shewanella eurypsychrophilus]